ncbi:hypothetical protein BX666DRAFT_1619285 [Dichotomocladium elegans]|nr:hypothetical protein BX666DRAFT_1619285 [Dichotomocladium elegans]
MIDQVGLDAAMYIRFLRMAVQYLMLLVTLICPALLTLHWIANTSEDVNVNTNSSGSSGSYFDSDTTLYRLSISNVPDQALLVWVHVVFIYILSLGWLWLLLVNHWHLLQKQNPHHHQRPHTVLITNVPHHLRNSQALIQYFSTEIGPVDSATLLSQAGAEPLQLALQRRQHCLDKLERLLIVLGRRQRHVHDWIRRLPPHPAIIDWLDKLDDIDHEINQLRELNRLSVRYCTPTGTAFVTFKSAESAQVCAQVVTSWKPGVFQTRLAPEPRDLLWEGLLRKGRRDKVMRHVRRWAVFTAVWVLTIFWLFPVSFILGLTSIESLSQHFGFFNYFLDASDRVRSFIQHVLPMLLVTLFMSLLPWVLMMISKQQDFVSYSDLEDTVLCRYYRFAIFNVLIVFLLGTTFLSTMLDVLYEPAKVIHLLAKFLPQGANFFLNYILFNTSTHAMELLQLGSQLFGHLIFSLPFISSTPRRLARYTKPWSFPFYYYYPNHILVFVIAVTYSVIQPLILIFGLLYFSLALVIFRHQFAYCYVRRYESNGFLYYRRMGSYTSDGLVISQLTMVGLLYLKGVLMAATAVLPILVFTLWAKVKLAKQYASASQQFRQRTHRHSRNHARGGGDDDDDDNEQQEREMRRRRCCGPRYACATIDDIWKLSFLKTWVIYGRYGCETSPISRGRGGNRSGGGDSRADVVARGSGSASTSTSSSADSLVDKCDDFSVPEDVVLEDSLVMYPDDRPRYYNGSDTRFEYPPLVDPLDRRLWLPRDPSQWHIQDVMTVSMDELRRIVEARALSLSPDSQEACITVKP